MTKPLKVAPWVVPEDLQGIYDYHRFLSVAKAERIVSQRNTSGFTLTLFEESEEDGDGFGRFAAGEADVFAHVSGGAHVEVLREPAV